MDLPKIDENTIGPDLRSDQFIKDLLICYIATPIIIDCGFWFIISYITHCHQEMCGKTFKPYNSSGLAPAEALFV